MNNITRQELQQYFYLNREIKAMEEELKVLKEKMKSTKAAKTAEMELLSVRSCILQGKINQCRNLSNKIEAFVSGIEDSLTRQIFYYRYIRFMTWRKVASMVGGYLSENGARMIVERYLKKTGKA